MMMKINSMRVTPGCVLSGLTFHTIGSPGRWSVLLWLISYIDSLTANSLPFYVPFPGPDILVLDVESPSTRRTREPTFGIARNCDGCGVIFKIPLSFTRSTGAMAMPAPTKMMLPPRCTHFGYLPAP